MGVVVATRVARRKSNLTDVQAAAVGLACLLLVALFEERMIRADRAFSGADGKDGQDKKEG